MMVFVVVFFWIRRKEKWSSHTLTQTTHIHSCTRHRHAHHTGRVLFILFVSICSQISMSPRAFRRIGVKYFGLKIKPRELRKLKGGRKKIQQRIQIIVKKKKCCCPQKKGRCYLCVEFFVVFVFKIPCKKKLVWLF